MFNCTDKSISVKVHSNILETGGEHRKINVYLHCAALDGKKWTCFISHFAALYSPIGQELHFSIGS